MNLQSPEGLAVWPKLNKPDDKYDKDGVYTVKIAVPESEAVDTITTLEKILNEDYSGHCKEQKRQKLRKAENPWIDEYDKDGVATGNILFKFKMKAKTASGIEMRPILVDADMKPMSDNIGGGSRLIVSYEPRTWYVPAVGVGMTLRLKGVQVLDLKEYSGGSNPDQLGFQKRDGFRTSTTPEESQKEEETEKAIQAHNNNGDF